MLFRRLNILRNQVRNIKSLKVSDEVLEAINSKKPVVALESTIITHGLPYPENIEMAKMVEQEIRNTGAIPATTAFIKGIPKVGLSYQDYEFLADQARKGKVNKVSRRDIAYTMANKLDGGTTISGTMILSDLTGIKVFATGGLGGVHFGGELSMDVSADLEELGRTPVAVVCAGPKAILDINRTMEYLETKGCMVATLGPQGTNVPGFYTRDSGVKSPYNFNSYHQAAQIVHEGNNLGMRSGYLFCIPPPEEIALDDKLIQEVISNANQKAIKMNIAGKDLTPFLLSEIAKVTKGASVKSNVAFVLNNARAASSIATNLSLLEKGEIDSFENLASQQAASGDIASQKITESQYNLVVGSIALDTHCKVESNNIHHFDSNPGKISSSIGGVGHNVALSASLSNRNPNLGTRLVSSVGDDPAGRSIFSQLNISKEGIFVDKNSSTAQYVSVHSQDGELVVGCADMNIATKIPLEHITNQILTLNPRVVLVDANVSVEIMNYLTLLQRDMGYKLIFEPTSKAKSAKLGQISPLQVYPNNELYLITPTVEELESIYSSFDLAGKFDLDNWFPVLDCLKVDRSISSLNSQKYGAFKRLLEKGIIQMASFLLPYIPKIIVKDGPRGIYVFSIERDLSTVDLESISMNCDQSFFSKGEIIDGHKYGLLIEHHMIPDGEVTASNVTGAGDTFVGVLLNEISSNELALDARHPLIKKQCLQRAQLGAKITIEDTETISSKLKDLP